MRQALGSSRMIGCMELLDRIVSFTYYTNDVPLMLLSISRMIQLTFRHGVCEYAPPAFTLLGLLVHIVSGDLQASAVCTDHALFIQKKFQIRSTESRAVMVAHAFVLPWTRPLRNSIKPLQSGYENGLQSCDTDSATWCLYGLTHLHFLKGTPLPTIEADTRDFIPHFEALKRAKAVHDSTCLQKYIRILMSDVSSSEDVEQALSRDLSYADYIAQTGGKDRGWKTVIYAHLGMHEVGAKLALDKGNEYLQIAPGLCFAPLDVVCRGLSLYATTRKHKNRKFEKAANATRKMLRKWLKRGNMNVQHYICLLDAEHAALKNRLDTASVFYKDSIKFAARGGFIHDAGMANERYADFLGQELQDKIEAKYHIEEAIRFYSEWGAKGKVKQLQMKYSEFWSVPEKALSSTLLVGEMSTDDGVIVSC